MENNKNIDETNKTEPIVGEAHVTETSATQDTEKAEMGSSSQSKVPTEDSTRATATAKSPDIAVTAASSVTSNTQSTEDVAAAKSTVNSSETDSAKAESKETQEKNKVHEEVHQEHAKRDKKKVEKSHKGKTAAVIVITIGVGLISGYAGGRIANYQQSNQINSYIDGQVAEAVKEGEKEDASQYDPFGDFYKAFGGKDSEEESSTPRALTDAVMGITVKDSDNGVVIVGFADGTKADQSKLKAGDVITSIDGTDIDTVADIAKILDIKKAGDTVSVVVSRNGKKQDKVSIELISRNDLLNNNGNRQKL